jgi:hypothetical protein
MSTSLGESAGRSLSRRLVKVAAVALALSPLGLLVAVTSGAAGSTVRDTAATAASAPSARSASMGASAASDAFRQTRTMERVNLINGQNVVVDKRTVTLRVNITSHLINRQIVTVNWTGAHPTGGIQPDPNDGTQAGDEEYPMVLLECHGTPGSKKPLADQIQPADCFTSTPNQRFFSASPDAPFPPWRLDRYATAAGQRNATENQPATVPKDCFLLNGPHFWLPFVTPTGKSYPVGPAGCAGMPDEMSLTGGLGTNLPSNETYAGTSADGKGSAAFDVWTSELAPDLGCSQQVPCALVAVPVMGISCDPAGTGMPPADQPAPGAQQDAAAAECEQTGAYPPGSFATPSEIGNEDFTVSGNLWWAASNWRNRFVVPLHFAPAANICSIVNKQNHFIQIYGSELLDQSMLQWQPHFCLNKKLFTLGYVGTSEPAAASDLASHQVEAALVSDQPTAGFGEPVVHAPVTATGFAVSFVIDNAQGVPLTTLRLDPRLLAKLLTESYPGVTSVADEDPEILHPCPGVPVPNSNMCTNPLDITQDPEFQALNPDVPKNVGASAAASVLLMLSTESDVTWALTSYINDNPAARAWLNGTPDPWGMTVSSAYKGIKLPVSEWATNSTFEPKDWLTGNGGGPGLCYVQNPSPVLPLIADPVPDLPDLAEDLQFYIAQPELTCAGNPDVPASDHLAALGPQTVGFRFMLGVTSLADARRYNLNTASLLTYSKPGTPDKFTSAAGMTFVPPTGASLRNAVSKYAPDKKTFEWNFPYALYGKDSKKMVAAYPGTMLVYADIPTKGLPVADATDYAKFLRFAATAGQVPGGGIGHLPLGYLPMTTANHLGAEQNYTMAAAAAVAAQAGTIPALLAKFHPAGSSPGTSPSPGSSSGTGSGPGSGSTSPSPSSTSGSSSAASPPPQAGKVKLAPEANFGIAGYALPVVAGLALIAAAGAVLIPRLTRRMGKKWQ